MAGGSIRTHDPKILKKVFEVLGHKKKEIEKDFGHLLEAFKYGAPPHGGIAIGLDRLIMKLLDEKSIREVIAFPKTAEARDPMTGAPRPVNKKQLGELGLSIKRKKKV
jgi:aspartyl-tRNA synthetase